MTIQGIIEYHSDALIRAWARIDELKARGILTRAQKRSLWQQRNSARHYLTKLKYWEGQA